MASNRSKYIDKTGGDNLSFSLINKQVIERRQKEGDIVLPKKKVEVPKDERWNTKQMNSKLLQGIMNGDSVPKMSKSMMEVIGNNKASAIRNTRTMITGAENVGRLDSYKMLEQRGVIQKKVWSSTPDDRTRPSHIDIDGEEQDIDKPFSNGCMYPGDGNGPPEEVWQCRCSMGDHIIGFKRSDGTTRYVDYERGRTLHDIQMDEERARRYGVGDQEVGHVVVQGKDITGTWQRRSDQFAFEIEDVINAQGFDGKPKVVSAEEFERYVQEANNGEGLIMQRTYSAPTQEVLDDYQKQLYEGKWYVDCSEGGAQYGQGMYCAADYTGTLSEGIIDEMKHYQELNVVKANTEEFLFGGRTYRMEKSGEKVEVFSNVETMTLSSDAKIINYRELVNMYQEEKYKMLEILEEDEYLKWSSERIGDIGAYAASKGYDAINAVGHGASGSYTVVLNRTKLIIKGGE